ncbi:MAG: 1,2-phenylacetyl-CoA epoxidase subunit PaaE [Ferruginibacter sp.]
MAVHFHPLVIKDLEQETSDSLIITFDVPESVKHLFQFTHGQNLTLKTTHNGEEVRRSYSICSAPFENKLSVAVKKVEQGIFSSYVHGHLQKGDIMQVLPPTGRFFTQLDPTHERRYLAFAAGSGITPVISIIKTTLALEPNSAFTLVYGNRSRSSIMFFEELEGLKNKYIQRFNFINILSREKTDAPINSGRMDTSKLSELEKLIDYKSFDEIFICGPQEMLSCVKSFLADHGISEKHIHFELFTTPGQANNEVIAHAIENNELLRSLITVKLDGRSFSFDLAYNSESILDAALKQGADLPYACKGGVCSSCRAKLTEGKVAMDANYALEQEEVAAGFILTCQSHPLTQRVVVDFDLR